TWTCRCGTLWLTRLLTATNEPSAPRPRSTARATRAAAPRTAGARSAGRSSSVGTCARGITSVWPGNRGRWAGKARVAPSSNTTCRAASPRARRQNAQPGTAGGSAPTGSAEEPADRPPPQRQDGLGGRDLHRAHRGAVGLGVAPQQRVLVEELPP